MTPPHPQAAALMTLRDREENFSLQLIRARTHPDPLERARNALLVEHSYARLVEFRAETRAPRTELPRVGDRVRTGLDLWYHLLSVPFDAKETGTVVSTPESPSGGSGVGDICDYSVLLDKHHPGLEEWDNCLHWNVREGQPLECILDDLEIIGEYGDDS